MVETAVKGFGQLDVLVNNAGIFEGGDPREITDAQWRDVMASDVDGVFYGCRAALPHLEGQRDRSSTRRRCGAGLGRKGIRINAVCPSLTRTGMTSDRTAMDTRNNTTQADALSDIELDAASGGRHEVTRAEWERIVAQMIKNGGGSTKGGGATGSW